MLNYRRLITIMLLLIMVVPLMAQDRAVPDGYQQIAYIDSVSMTHNEDGTFLLVDLMPTGCSTLLTDVYHNNNFIRVTLYTVPAEIDARCRPGNLTHQVNLGAVEIDRTYTLQVNDFKNQFFIPREGLVPMDVPAQLIEWHVPNDLIPFTYEPIGVEEITVVSTHPLELIITGGASSCQGFFMEFIYPDALYNDVYHIGVVRPLPEGTACPRDYVQFSHVLSTVDIPDNVYFTLNGMGYYQIVDADLLQIYRLPITVQDVVIEAANGSYDVTVNGMHADCPTATNGATLLDEAETSVISIYQDRPNDAVCTSVLIPFEQSFSVQNPQVYVNGTLYLADELAGGRNFMQSDTVIESVDVIVLESFPMQLNLQITGYHPDGCEFPVTVEQMVQENDVQVHIYREVPDDVLCPMMIVPYEESIRVDGSFSGGTVTIDVNGFVVTVDL